MVYFVQPTCRFVDLCIYIYIYISSKKSEYTRPVTDQRMLSILATMVATMVKADPLYIVTMVAPPAPLYTGGVEGLAATAPAPGSKIDSGDAAVVAYCAYLDSEHDAALVAAGASAGDKVLTYHFGVSGFAAEVTKAQADALRALDAVDTVEENHIQVIQTKPQNGGFDDPAENALPERRRQMASVAESRRRMQAEEVGDTGDFLGLNVQGGARDKGYDGEGIVVGYMCGGVWPEHPSFADDGSYGPPPASFTGTGCDYGNYVHNALDVPFTCNNKLLASKYYDDAWGSAIPPEGFDSSRDPTGLGTGLVGVMAGNMNVPVTIDGIDFGTLTGIAPRSRVSVYKVCHLITATSNGCATADIVKAIDDAINDGVDVIDIGFSSGTHRFTTGNTVRLNAIEAGIVVTGIAGGDGGAIRSPATPWLINTAASTTDRDYVATLSLDGEDPVPGANHGVASPTADLVDAEDFGNQECVGGAFTASVTGKIVLCLNDAGPRDSYMAQSKAVFDAGGVGMVLYNTNPLAQLELGNYFVPYIILEKSDGESVKTLIGGASISAKINAGVSSPNAENEMFSLQGKGPSDFSNDLIKPDATMPAVNILAPTAPYRSAMTSGYFFTFFSSTSYGNAQVAGMSALLKQAHPNWSPAMIKSAIMTSAHQDVVKADGFTPADPFDFGAGHVNPGGNAKKGKAKKGSMFEPGLVYDAERKDYEAFLCGAGYTDIVTTAGCEALAALEFSLDPSDLNLPSIAIGELVIGQTVTRTVTSVASEVGWRTYTVSVDAPSGTTVTITPATAHLKKGMTFNYEVTVAIDTGSVVFDEWTFGSLTWSSSKYSVRSPIAVRPVVFNTLTGVFAEGQAAGTLSVPVEFAYTGAYEAISYGLVEADKTEAAAYQSPTLNAGFDLFSCYYGTGATDDAPTQTALECGITPHVFTFTNVAYARFEIFDDETTPADVDLDMFLFTSSGGLAVGFVGASASGTSSERIEVFEPADGDYSIYIQGFNTRDPFANYTLHAWLVAETPGTLLITSEPASAVYDTTGAVNMSYPALATADTRYIGIVNHDIGAAEFVTTIVTIDT